MRKMKNVENVIFSSLRKRNRLLGSSPCRCRSMNMKLQFVFLVSVGWRKGVVVLHYILYWLYSYDSFRLVECCNELLYLAFETFGNNDRSNIFKWVEHILNVHLVYFDLMYNMYIIQNTRKLVTETKVAHNRFQRTNLPREIWFRRPHFAGARGLRHLPRQV